MIASNRQFLCTVGAVPNRTFTGMSGGAKTASASKYYDGGSTRPDVISSPPETSNVTLKNGYRPDTDPAIIRTLLGQIGILYTQITRVPLYGDMTRVPSAKPDVYTDALLVGVTPPEPDANSGDAAEWSLEFAVSDWT